MKKTIILLSLIISFYTLFSQSNETNEQNNKHTDTEFSYEAGIPDWLNIRETGDPKLWGGSLPAVDGIENAIVISAYYKNEFKSFTDFKNKIIEKDVMGRPTQMSSSHIFMGKKVLDEIEGIGPAYIQYHMWNNYLYACQFVLCETKTAYLLINFAATSKTYYINLEKFEAFIKGFKITE